VIHPTISTRIFTIRKLAIGAMTMVTMMMTMMMETTTTIMMMSSTTTTTMTETVKDDAVVS